MTRARRVCARRILVPTLAALAAPVEADELFLADGSRVVGEIERLADGELLIATGFAGTLTVAADAIAGIVTDGRFVTALESGERLVGRLGYDPQGGQRVASERLGTVAIDVGRVSALWPPEQPSPEMTEAARAHAEELADLEAKHVSAAEAWSGNIQTGLQGVQGNSERFSWNGRAEAIRESTFDRLSMFVQARFAEEDGEETENEQSAGTRLEHDVSPRMFTFGDLKLERDEFEELDLRAIVTGGGGVFLIREENQNLKPRIGFGWQQESFENGESDSQAIFSAGFDYDVRMNGWLTFVHQFTYFPELSDPAGDYRLDSRAVFELLTRDAAPWSIRLGVENQFDATPRPGIEELDTTYFVNLGYAFD